MKKVMFFGLLAILLAFSFVGCGNGSTTNGDRYNIHSNAEYGYIHQNFFDTTFPGLGVIVDPSNVHLMEFNISQRAQIIQHLKNCHGYNSYLNQTEAQVIALTNVIVSFGLPVSYVPDIINTMKTRGWVVFVFGQNDGEQNLIVIEKV